jgi:nitrate/TMAO reductase-like tetraheme cytochrome c subunit
MRRTTLLTAILALLVAPAAMAKPTTVKGAKCTICHEGSPKDKKFNAATHKMFPKYKEDKCKDCHSVVDGKFTSKKK